MRRCSKCGKQKLFSAFYKDKRDKSGFTCWCKQCCKEYQQSNKGKQAFHRANKKYCQTHKKQRNEYSRKYRKTLIGCLRDRFRAIKQRCNNPKATGYKYWGGRGIKCLFRNADEFIDYIINNLGYNTLEKLKGLEIDRIDNNGHYEIENIRFITHKENNNNKQKRC